MFIGFDNSDRVSDAERKPLQFYLLGTREEVQSAINQLHVLRFSDRVRWSPPIPVLGSDWKYISMMEREQATE
ncbi:hypothetical protein [Alkalinema sp. FACHB-956]|uniref:hypothetical protein n=1 Tax=Alkalinema sp. FACHB-956 TaxID=2692768 RepID=UPI001687D444|nr:hypothetical protein [Alkalinema sp. FACHB-956]MBD2330114.1 hypothetical protein [Alkalinema sp. FACHB-956]